MHKRRSPENRFGDDRFDERLLGNIYFSGHEASTPVEVVAQERAGDIVGI
jgi:hypothetical protein